MKKTISQHLYRAWGLLALHALLASTAHAEVLSADAQQRVRAATFEVVQRKPESDPLTYEKELPLELIPYQQRVDKFRSIGTSFAIGVNRFVTAAHVLAAGIASQYGLPALRNAAGDIFIIDQILKYSQSEDFVVFSLQSPPSNLPFLIAGSHPRPNDPVMAVGNALGEGIVIRDGIFTSETPEEDQGRWQWLRFTAAASPGNSGGPLIDHLGKVIGVVSRKSASENLNYAVPFQLLMDAPENQATVDGRVTYRLPLMDASEIIQTHERIPLPQSLHDFYQALFKIVRSVVQRGDSQILEHNKARLFPNGATSAEILHSTYSAPFPRRIRETSDRQWTAVAMQPRHVQLDNNGFVQFSENIFQLRAPDNIELAELYGNSKLFMDLMLQGAYPLHRQVGADMVKITSLGKAVQEAVYIDHYGRLWQLKVWPVPFDDAYIVALALPTPQAYIAFVTKVASAVKDNMIAQQELLCDYIYFSLEGTLSRWREYLALKKMLPAAFASMSMDIDPNKHIQFRSKRMTLEITKDMQKLDKDSALMLQMSYFEDGGTVVWDVGGIDVGENTHDGNWLETHRIPKPNSNLTENFQTTWRKIGAAEYPFNETAFSATNGRTRINAAAAIPGVPTDEIHVRYVLSALVEGQQDQSVMKKMITALQDRFKALEH